MDLLIPEDGARFRGIIDTAKGRYIRFDKEGLIMLKQSKRGFRNPIVVSRRSGFITKGHGRLAAARLLKMERVPVDFKEYESEAAEWADMVADNRVAELAEIDEESLKALIQELDGRIDLDLTGFDADSLDDILARLVPRSEATTRPGREAKPDQRTGTT